MNRHQHAKEWAVANRALIAERVAATLKTKATRILDICHNFVEPIRLGANECWLHRKGAAPSTEGAVLIPGSRGAFTYVMRPAEPTERSAFSLAHGAGRKWARSDCRGRLENVTPLKISSGPNSAALSFAKTRTCYTKKLRKPTEKVSVVIEDLVHEGLAEVIGILRQLITYKVRR